MAAPTDAVSEDRAPSQDQFVFSYGAANPPLSLTTADASLFLPSNVQVARPVRAWERKPTSAFVNGRSHTRKIWKRAPLAPKIQQVVSQRRSRLNSPKNAKSVKRRCVSNEEAVSTQWEVLSSPAKRITTRSSSLKELTALPELEPTETQEEPAEVDGTIIEIVNDDGTVTRPEDAARDAEQWADVEEFNDTLMHLEDAVNHEPEVQISTVDDHEFVSPALQSEAIVQEINEGNISNTPTKSPAAPIAMVLPTFALPAGFVSPVKRHRSVSKRLQQSGRRRTLPQAFAPVLLPPQPSMQMAASTTPDIAQTPRNDDLPTNNCGPAVQATEEIEWEDVGVVEAANKDSVSDAEVDEAVNKDSVQDAIEDGAQNDLTGQSTPKQSPEQALKADELSVERSSPILEPPRPATNVVRVRRSPRRKSSSPVKARTVTILQETPHIIAFTPVKRVHREEIDQSAPRQSSPSVDLVPQTPPSMFKASEDIQQARRFDRSRLSDDTALLQAFLDRAAQNKHVEEQPHFESRTAEHNSSSVDQIPSSPATLGALVELDPNTTSPRRLLIPKLDDEDSPDQLEDDDSDAETALPDLRPYINPYNRNRRSSRIMTTAPAKITLRGVQENLAVKRTPAQELLLLTGRNTRANKADAVPPSRRVPALMAELLEFSSAISQPVNRPPKKKSVTWNKALVYFQLDSPAVENAEMTDAGPPPASQDEGSDTAETADVLVVPVEPLQRRATPGKPRVRLRAPAAPVAAIDETQAPPQRRERTNFRSSIVPPTKRSAGPERTTSSKSTIPLPTGQPGTRRKVQSRLPAPVSTLEAVPSIDTSIQIGTSATIMSPPKRRASLFIPNFEANAIKAEAVSKSNQAPGLLSPAKKPRRALVFGSENQNNKQEDAATKLKDIPNLSSPAKKRVRRVC